MPSLIWTKDECHKRALLHGSRTEFFRAARGAYMAAHRKGWLDEVCAHMPARKASGPYKYTDEVIEEIARRYWDFATFRVEQSSLFTLLCQTNRLDRFTSHMQRTRAPNGYWTKDRCAEKASECATRSDFIARFPAAADAAYREGWIDEICSHMERIGNHKLRVIYVIKALGEKRCYVGISAHAAKRYRTHLVSPMRHLVDLISGPHRFRVITGLIPVAQALDVETRLCERLRAKGYEVLNRSRGGQSGSMPRKWTRAALQDLADSLDTRGQMMREHPGAYDAAHHNGWLDELFSRHENRGFGDGPVRDYTEGMLREIAASCVNKAEMKRRHDKAWQAAFRRGILDDLFADRPNGGATYEVWSRDRITDHARRFQSRAEFKSNDPKAHRAARRRGLLDQLFPKAQGVTTHGHGP